MTQPNEQLLQLYRANLRTTLDVMKVCLDGAERLRNGQLQAIQDAKADGADWLQNLESAQTADELIPLQQKLALGQLENVLGYWSSLFHAVSQAQIEILRQTQRSTGKLAGDLRRDLDGASGAGDPAFAAFNAMLRNASAAYEQAASVNEQAIRLTENAIVTAEAGIRAATGGERKAA